MKLTIFAMILPVCFMLASGAMGAKPEIKKLGTIDCDMVETTPIVFNGKLYRIEYVRKVRYVQNTTDDSYFRFIDVVTGKATPSFAKGFHLGCAHVEGDTVYVYGITDWGQSTIHVFWSKDMENWQSKMAIDVPGWVMFNTSVCKGPQGYVMAMELRAPAEEVGVPYTLRFAESDDLINWRLTPRDNVFSKEFFTACPAIRFVDGYYYVLYGIDRPGPNYVTCIARSKDLIKWELSPLNPMMEYSDEDRKIASSTLTMQQRERIATAANINCSDVDLCEFEGKTIIYYTWGNQMGIEHLAEAVYEGPLDKFLKAWFPENAKK